MPNFDSNLSFINGGVSLSTNAFLVGCAGIIVAGVVPDATVLAVVCVVLGIEWFVVVVGVVGVAPVVMVNVLVGCAAESPKLPVTMLATVVGPIVANRLLFPSLVEFDANAPFLLLLLLLLLLSSSGEREEL